MTCPVPTTGPTVESTRDLIREAIALHLRDMREHGVEPPVPSITEYVEVI